MESMKNENNWIVKNDQLTSYTTYFWIYVISSHIHNFIPNFGRFQTIDGFTQRRTCKILFTIIICGTSFFMMISSNFKTSIIRSNNRFARLCTCGFCNKSAYLKITKNSELGPMETRKFHFLIWLFHLGILSFVALLLRSLFR